jgi:cephalosporin hydroxylase
VDFLWIDGDHTYEGCKADYENYSPLVVPGGLIGIHDYNMPDVRRFVDTLPDKKIINYGLGTVLVEKK